MLSADPGNGGGSKRLRRLERLAAKSTRRRTRTKRHGARLGEVKPRRPRRQKQLAWGGLAMRGDEMERPQTVEFKPLRISKINDSRGAGKTFKASMWLRISQIELKT
jgi:hypothetical protein